MRFIDILNNQIEENSAVSVSLGSEGLTVGKVIKLESGLGIQSAPGQPGSVQGTQAVATIAVFVQRPVTENGIILGVIKAETVASPSILA